MDDGQMDIQTSNKMNDMISIILVFFGRSILNNLSFSSTVYLL